MATVTKNFRIKSGLVVEGTSGTIDGHNILTESTSGDQYILNLVGGATLVKSVDTGVFNVDGAGNLTINSNTFDSYGSASAAQTAAATDATNKANQALADAQTYANSLASNYDAAGSASTAESNANSYTDTKIANSGGNYLDWNGQQLDVDTNGIAQAFSQTFDSYGSASTAEIDAKAYADSLINDASTTSTNAWSAYKTSTEIGLAQAAAELHADNAVAALVGSAPAVLDTIQELATALENNPDIIADLENVAAGKQNTLTAGSNIDITQDTISVTGLDTDDVAEGPSRLYFTNTRAQDAIGAGTGLTKDNQGTELAINRQAVDTWYDAAGSAADAQTNAENFASGLVGNLLDATTPFESLNLNDVAKQVAARTTSLGSVAVTAYHFNKSAFKSGKFLVKIDNGTHNEISEILVTLDSSDNVAITEYAIVGTNGTRGTITADVDSTHCRIRVTPVNDSTITVAGTVFNA